MTKAILDTNILLRILLNDDQEKARDSIDFVKNAPANHIQLFVPMMALIEIAFVLERQYKLKKFEIKEYIDSIVNTAQLRCENPELMKSAVDIYVSKNIKFGDAVISAWALQNNIHDIYTYDDKDFKRVSGLNVKSP